MTDVFDASAFLASVTTRCGVYQMYDAEGALLYVGKARNLRNRLSSYFRNSGLNAKTVALVMRIHDIQVTVTSTEADALLLEHNLIKAHKPPFNILLRDDKSYPYVFLSSQDRFPRLALHRGRKRAKGSYFGPYPSAGAVRQSLHFLQRVFKVRQCEDSYFATAPAPACNTRSIVARHPVWVS
jgi:excinuclease ABC subunit C